MQLYEGPAPVAQFAHDVASYWFTRDLSHAPVVAVLLASAKRADKRIASGARAHQAASAWLGVHEAIMAPPDGPLKTGVSQGKQPAGSGVRALWGPQWTRLPFFTADVRSTATTGAWASNGAWASPLITAAAQTIAGAQLPGSMIGMMAPPLRLPLETASLQEERPRGRGSRSWERRSALPLPSDGIGTTP
jgi:hypothetical protein